MAFLKTYLPTFLSCLSVLSATAASAQEVKPHADSLVLENKYVRVVFQYKTGAIHYQFATGASFSNTSAYVEELEAGLLQTGDFQKHSTTTDALNDPLGKGICVNFTHEDERHAIRLVQHVTLYETQPYALISLEAEPVKEGKLLETRNISPFVLASRNGGAFSIAGDEPRILDVPFDNDNWVNVLERKWDAAKPVSGTSYEFASVYDNARLGGFVIGTLLHDFWKTGIRYAAAAQKGALDSLVVYGGAATRDNPSLPGAHGGYDGTHDHMPHGTMRSDALRSPLLYLSASGDVRKDFVQYGELNKKISGSLSWKGYAPFYWNSFGVENVLGYTNIMMPAGVVKVSDFIASLKNFNKYAPPVLSIDSYDQNIYSTNVLNSISRYGEKKRQQMGFYFIPFAVWTWKNSLDQTKIQGSEYIAKDVVLRDGNGQVIPYKDGDWAAYPLDPTHPAVRGLIIHNLKKARAINATFLKIDFLSAGALESAKRYDPSVRTGMQAYNTGMKMLKHLVDSMLGPDVFITMAISPMFPHQYAHTRFISTDVYSHLRDDMPGFPHYGGTQASLSNGSHYWWMKGTLWPYTNLDVVVMKNFQKNADLDEQTIKVRLYAMMAMGSILGDGSDLRNKLAADRAVKFLDNPEICRFFSDPEVFTPLHFSDGETPDQQLAFYLPGDTTLVGLFNFYKEKEYTGQLYRQALHLEAGAYELRELISGEKIGVWRKQEDTFLFRIPPKDAYMLKLVPVQE